MKTLIFFLLAGAFVLLGQHSVYAHPTGKSITDLTSLVMPNHEESDEEEFVVESAQGALLEVKLGELAQTNASAQVVKDFGKMMTKDHSKGYDELKTLALQKKITIPAGLSKKGQRKYDKLAKKTGHEFDKEYMDYMVEDHDSDIEAFEETVDESKDADIKAWAAKALPMLKQHLAYGKKRICSGEITFRSFRKAPCYKAANSQHGNKSILYSPFERSLEVGSFFLQHMTKLL